MAKSEVLFICSNCGAHAPRWTGQCSGCGEWNTMVEEKVEARAGKSRFSVSSKVEAKSLIEAHGNTPLRRLASGIEELDRVLGGGFVPGSLILLSGDPGIGKSTVALEAAVRIGQQGKALYISGEESVEQIAERAIRCGFSSEGLVLANSNSLTEVIATIESEKPALVVLDSIQVIGDSDIPSASGTMTQIRSVTESLMHLSKSKKIPILMIGHVTKSGEFSGPQLLAHLVDTVLFLEGERYAAFRLLRAMKNRFGATDEVGVFEMTEKGLSEVKNPSQAFLSGRAETPIGSAIVPIVEGTRPFLIELQALAIKSGFSTPRRTASGVDINRLHLMIAVLERFGGIPMAEFDAFANIIGGLRLSDPSADLALCVALASSRKQMPIPREMAIIGEVGLSGEIRSVPQLQKRISECEKLGFTTIILPKSQAESLKTSAMIIGVKTVQEALLATLSTR